MGRPIRSSMRSLLFMLAAACGGGEGSSAPAATGTTSLGGTTLEPWTTGADTSEAEPGCSVAVNDCPSGNKCTVISTATGELERVCVPILGTDRPGEACELEPGGHGRDSCAAGSVCAGEPPDTLCAGFCGFDDACTEGATCVRILGNQAGDEGLPLCLDECQPLQAECPLGWACSEDAGAQRWYCAPRLGGQEGGYGSACDRLQLGLCAPGYACLVGPALASEACRDTNTIGCCGQLCDLDGEVACPGEGESCLPFYPDVAPPGLANLGVCALLQGA